MSHYQIYFLTRIELVLTKDEFDLITESIKRSSETCYYIEEDEFWWAAINRNKKSKQDECIADVDIRDLDCVILKALSLNFYEKPDALDLFLRLKDVLTKAIEAKEHTNNTYGPLAF